MSDKELTPPPAPAIRSPSESTAGGDWTCAECSNVNFARRSSCNRCSKPRVNFPVQSKSKKKLGQEIGKQMAEKSRGLFSADDWQCNKCGNVNWARRQQCNVCNAPKFGEVEERTGFGGGYNDRGVVEYKERPASDDEYDEFGRRKKKRGENGYKSPREEVKERIDKEQEEEEEDEDEDDGDLSKYDLSDWGDAPPSKKSRTQNRSSRSRSHSRSRSPLDKN